MNIDDISIKKYKLVEKNKPTSKAQSVPGKELNSIDPVQYHADGSTWIKTTRNLEQVAPNFQIFIKYVAEDENEQITWVLEIRQLDAEPIYLEVPHEEFCSASKLRKMIATKQLALKINDNHLQELHAYLFNKTKYNKATKIIRFGYHADSGAYVFSNGAYHNGEVVKPDNFNIVEAGTGLLSLPKVKAGVQHPFTITGHQTTFNEWYGIYQDAHTRAYTFIPACWYIMALFRDVAIRHKSFSPFLYLKGPHGSGKSSIVRHLTCLFGFPLKEVNLKSRNSEAGIIRIMSQNSNAIIWFDEFTNNHPLEGILQAAYDNSGQIKAEGTSGLETENVDIRSAEAITSNYMPDNNIFFSRCIYLPVMNQQKTAEQKKSFDHLTAIESKGLAAVTMELLQNRRMIEIHYAKNFDLVYNGLKKHPAGRQQPIPERLFSNMAQAMTAAYTLAMLKKISITEAVEPGEDMLAEFVEAGIENILRQHRISAEKTALHEFFEVMQMLYDSDYRIHEGSHFRFEHEYITIRFGSVYSLFKDRYFRMHFKESPSKDDIRQELIKVFSASGTEEEIFKQKRFYPEEMDNTGSTTVPIKDTLVINYTELVDKYAVDFRNRRKQGKVMQEMNERKSN